MKNNLSGKKLGILGGGQLGQMLVPECQKLGLETSILDNDAECSCAKLDIRFVKGNIQDFETVLDFGKDLDVVTIEIEHVNADALEELSKRGVKVYPQPHVIKTVQDKGLQKIFYRVNRIPTAGFFLVENKAELLEHQKTFPFIQKSRTAGYDGKGVKLIRNEQDMEQAFDAPSVIEIAIDIDKEISVLVARNPSEEVRSFPVVELVFNPEANLVDFLISPAGISETLKKQATEIAEDLIRSLNMVGLLAVEMFLTKSGELLVNEIAPRPHNSGHQTIEGNITSQYRQHLLAVFDQPLGNTDIISPAVMINLLGEKGFDGIAKYEGIEKVTDSKSVFVHLYGKKITRPFRKMGHATVLGKTVEEAMGKAMEVKRELKVIS